MVWRTPTAGQTAKTGANSCIIGSICDRDRCCPVYLQRHLVTAIIKRVLLPQRKRQKMTRHRDSAIMLIAMETYLVLNFKPAQLTF